MRVLVDHGNYALLNLGDLAMLQACVRRLWELWPDAEIRVFTVSPELLAEYCPGTVPVAPTVLGRGLARVIPVSVQLAAGQILKTAAPLISRGRTRSPNGGSTRESHGVLDAVRQADLVVSAGGGFINDLFWWHGAGVLSVLAMAQRLGVPTAMFGQGIGPLTHPVLTRLATRVMPRLHVIGVRESLTSVPLLRMHGVEQQRIAITGDDALYLATPAVRPATGTAIGLNIRVAYYSKLDKSVAERANAVVSKFAREHGATVLGLPVARYKVALPVSRYNSDSDLDAMRLSSTTGSDGSDLHEFADISTTEEFAERAARCRVVVTGCYHAAVFGLAAGAPAICISNSRYYDLKFEGLADQFPDGCYLVHPGPGFERELRETIERAWAADEARRDSVHAAARAQVAEADRAYARLRAV